MNPRIGKLKEEREKTARRMEVLKSRLDELDRKITELENTDIIGVVREQGLTPEQLADLMDRLRKNPVAHVPESITKKENENNDEE
jgi:predicted nuclease with TOPRIM domain